MNPSHLLLYLRIFELILMSGCVYWVLFYFPPSRIRTIRLWLGSIFLFINLTAIFIVVSVIKTQLW